MLPAAPPQRLLFGEKNAHPVISHVTETYAIIISMADETYSKALKALADPTRLHIVELLSECCCGSAAVGDTPTAGEVCCHLTGLDKITSTVSHHLHELETAELIRLERKGKCCLCSLRPEKLEDLGAFLISLAKGAKKHECC